MRYVIVHAIDATFENGKIVGAANEATAAIVSEPPWLTAR